MADRKPGEQRCWIVGGPCTGLGMVAYWRTKMIKESSSYNYAHEIVAPPKTRNCLLNLLLK